MACRHFDESSLLRLILVYVLLGGWWHMIGRFLSLLLRSLCSPARFAALLYFHTAPSFIDVAVWNGLRVHTALLKQHGAEVLRMRFESAIKVLVFFCDFRKKNNYTCNHIFAGSQ